MRSSETYQLTHPQKRIWFTEEFFPNTSISNIGGLAHVEADQLDFGLLEQAIQAFLQLNDSIRLRIVWDQERNEPRQYFAPYTPVNIPYYDFSGSADRSELDAWAQNQFEQPLPMIDQDLFEFAVIKESEQKGHLFIKVHHILMDGMAFVQIVNQIITLYTELVRNVNVLENTQYPIPAPYTEYIQGEMEYEQSERFAKDRAFWHAEFDTLSEFTGLKTQDAFTVSTKARRKRFIVPQALRDEAQAFCKEHNISIFTLFMSMFHVYVYRLTGQSDITIGTTCYNRTQRKEKDMIGMLVSTMPFRVQGEPEQDILSFIRNVAKKQTKLFRHQKYPYNQLVQEVREKHPDVNGLFRLFAGFQVLGFEQIDGVRYIFDQLFMGHLTEEIALHVQDHHDKDLLTIEIDYITDVFTEADIDKLTDHLFHLMEDAIHHPDKRVDELQMLTDAEKDLILGEFSEVITDYPREKTIHECFEQQVALTPERTALVFESKTMTYAELNERANQVAHHLRKAGVKRKDVVGLIADRSFEMIIGIMGILKAGGAYLPIDPEFPAERISFMLEDTQANVLLSQSHMADLVSFHGQVIKLEDPAIDANDTTNPVLVNDSQDRCYIIYTSGTTGKPKGIVTLHTNVNRVVKNTNYIDINEDHTLLQLSNYAFDGSTFDIFGALLNGAKLVLMKKETVTDIVALSALIRDESVTAFFSTTALFNTLVEVAVESLQGVRKILFGGERCSVRHIRKALEFLGPDVLIHVYGPTETTVFATYYPINEVPEKAVTVPIGKPLANTELYVLDAQNKIQPIGVAGELCIAGDGVALGYLNREDLTAEKFVPHPFRPGKVMYRSGDLVKWLPDGNIEYLDRIDMQVKIRGFRIELGEIEAKLNDHEAVKEAVVIAREDEPGHRYLCAYVVVEQDQQELPNVSDWKAYLSQDLPHYMIPTHFVSLDKMPLTTNGKIDKRALPKPDTSLTASKEYVAPRTESEAKLAEIWQDVLGIERIGIHENFFELGGHSLKATVLVSQIHKAFGIHLSIRYVFQFQTIAEMIHLLESGMKEAAVTQMEEKTTFSSIEPVETRDYYPLSAAQRRMLITSQLEGASVTYNMPNLWKIEGEIDPARLERAIQILIDRHDSFRTSFVWVDGEPVQQIKPSIDFTLDHQVTTEEEIGVTVGKFVQSFELAKAPLFRAQLITYGEKKHLLMLDMHHIISDGVSIAVLFDEWSKLYVGEELPELRVQYKDFAVWQEELFKTDVMEIQEQYWLRHMDGEIPVLQLPTDFPRPAVQSFDGATVSFLTDAKLTQSLRDLAAQTGTTMYMVLLTAFQVLLSKYSGQHDILVGTAVAGRPHADLQSMIGMFVSTLVMRGYPEAEKTFAAFLEEMKEASLRANENQDYPLETMIEKLGIKRDLSRNPLFDVMFVLQNTPRSDLAFGDATVSPYPLSFDIAKFDLTFEVADYEDHYQFAFNYCTKLFKQETVERMLAHFVQILHAILHNPSVRLSEIDMLTVAEKETLLQEYNPAPTPYPADRTIHQLFEEQVSLRPDHPALYVEGQLLTYRELNEKANQLARHLREKGVQADQLVAIMADRSVEMIVSIFAILKAGGAYVSIDPIYPAERIGYMLTDSQAQILLTQRPYAENVPFDGHILLVDDESLYSGETANPDYKVQTTDLAYVIYTSGTTGKPKGVMVEHHGIPNLIQNIRTHYGMSEQDRVMQYASSSFDVSVKEIFMALLNGATLYVPTKETTQDPALYEAYMREHQITAAILPPVFAVHINPDQLTSLRLLFTGGSATTIEMVRTWSKRVRYVNAYGPTEASVQATGWIAEEREDGLITIGKPLDNVQLYVVNSAHQLQPIGVPGELCIGGVGLARGYLNRPELTAAAFVTNPYVPGELMYKTGDLVRWMPDGNIEYLGRLDDQVKVRGYRIELGEIEAQLLTHDEIIQTIVIPLTDEHGTTDLAAYLTATRELSVTELRQHIGKHLPSYMIPAYFVQLDEMPLTVNGKIDKKALPKPEGSKATGLEYTAPVTDTQAILADAWGSVLGIDRVGINDNFFEIGGDSIKAIQISARLHKEGLKLEMRDLFKHPTIAELSQFVKSVTTTFDQGMVEGEVPLTPIQHWFFATQDQDRHHFNQANMIFRAEGFDREKVAEVFGRIIEHHDALRMSYGFGTDGVIEQVNQGVTDAPFHLEEFDLTHVTEEKETAALIAKEADRLHAGIDLTGKGPLVQLGLFHTVQGDHLLIVIHHLVVDGVSWRILLEDFSTGYAQSLRGEAIVFPAKTVSFKEWATRLQSYATSKALLKEVPYWNQLEQTPIQALPRDEHTGENRKKDSSTLQIQLSKAHTKRLLTHVHHAYHTEINDLLLTALGMTLSAWTGADHQLILLEGHGREDIMEGMDITRTVGWFTSAYPVVIHTNQSDIAAQIKQVKETLRQIPNKGVGYGILQYLTPAEYRESLTFALQPEISFNYLGQFDQDSATEVFAASSMPSGEALSDQFVRGQQVEINGGIFGGKLQMALAYNHHAFGKATMKRLADQFKANLIAIIEHCAEQKVSEQTPSDVGARTLTIAEFEQIKATVQQQVKEAAITKAYPLSPMQEGMLFHAMLEPDSPAYFEQNCIPFTGRFDLALMEQSLHAVLARYDALRTVFVHEHLARPHQIVLRERTTTIHFEDWSTLGEEEQQARLTAFREQDKQRGFDLSRDVLLRISVFQTGVDTYRMLISFHHIILDGWCFVLVLDELLRTYHAALHQTQAQLGVVYPYSDYIGWLENQDREEALAYWQQYLAGYEHLATLPKWRTPKTSSYVQGSHIFFLDKATTAGLERLAKQHQTTLNNVFQSLWGILLGRYNGVTDVVFGAVVSGRNADVQGIEQIVGLFINSIPVRVQPNAAMSFVDLLKDVQAQSLASSAYDYLSLAETQALSSLKKDLLDHLVVFENYPTPDEEETAAGEERLRFDFAQMDAFEQTNYDFTVLVAPNDELYINFKYNAVVYDPQLVENIASHLSVLAQAIVTNPEAHIGTINILTDAEKHQVLGVFNDTEADFPRDKTIHQLMEATVARIPDQPAVYFQDQQLTYGELNHRANQVARTLRANGVTANSIVGIMAERSLEMIVGIMGIIKAGGAYLPLDPKHPQDRLEFTLEDSQAQVLLTQSHLIGVVAFDGLVIDLDQPDAYHEDGSNLEHINQPTDMAYVIYTSGSTGKPKGAMIEHWSVLNRLLWMDKAYPLGESDVILQKTPFTFDVSVWEMFWWSFVGAQVSYLIPEGEKEPATIVNEIERRRVTTMHFVPSMLHAFLEHIDINRSEISRLASLRHVFASGEALQVAHVERFNRLLHEAHGTKLINLYGPTEATVDVSVFDCSTGEALDTVPIGKPIDNTQLYVVSPENQLQPIGVAGELCIGGVQLARGYLNRPELTAEKFVENPFVPGERMYRTGDLTRWMPDGNIEYLGRIDHQVKIRGYRIELGEIETQILAHPDLKETVVVAREDHAGEKYLCAYIVATREITASEMREFLSEELPNYFIPSHFVQLESMPLSANGKIDRKALPTDGFIGSGTEYIAPRNEREEKLVTIWKELLGMEQVGVRDDFFVLGGHSLKATVLVSKLHKEFDTKIALRDIFTHTTVEQQAELIGQSQKQSYAAIQPVETRDYYPVSSTQKRVLIIAQMEGAETAYNMPVVLTLNGTIDAARLELALQELVQRHESLRTSFDWIDGEPVQRIHPEVRFEMPLTHLASDTVSRDELLSQAVQGFIRPFDLSQAPLIRAELVTFGEDDHALMIDMHHIISDGVSLNILFEELSQLYAGGQLPELRIQYKDFAAWQQAFYQTDAMKQQEAYWLEALSGEIPSLTLPTDFARPSVQSFEGDIVPFSIDKELVQELRRLASETGTTLYMVLLSAFQAMLAKYSGQEEILVGSPIAGRPHADLESIVGMFVGTLVLRGYPARHKTFDTFLQEMKETALHAFENQDYPFEELLDRLDVKRDMSRNPLFDVMFTLQNMGRASVSLDGVTATPYEGDLQLAKFDLTLAAEEGDDELVFYLNYCTKLFRADTMQRMAGHYTQVLRSIVSNHQIRLSEIDMVTDAEKEQLITAFNLNSMDYPQEATIHQIFEMQAANHPAHPALYYQGQQLSYQELNEKANQLARLLIAEGVKRDDIVAIMADRSLEMIIAIMAVLKAGGAYVPVDPVYPIDRIQYMLEDSQAKVLLTQSHLNEKVPTDIRVMNLDDASLYHGDTSNPEQGALATDLAYVIYTSGTTGKPKGVMLEHHGIVSLHTYVQSQFELGKKDRFTQFASFSFDASVLEIMMCLLSGATLYLPTQEIVQDPAAFGTFVETNQITVSFIPPVYITSVDPDQFKSLRLLITGGSASNKEIVQTWKDRLTYWNAYGPTESSIMATAWIARDRTDGVVPIGQPISNTQVYIVNTDNQLQPVGIPGELCISGTGLARGYFNRPDLTEQAFVQNPFVPGERMYKTGDLVRWLPDGNIEYLGRIDDQVKVRGYRIELGEIEAQLLTHEDVRETVVLAHTDERGQTELCAYLVASRNLPVAELRSHIGQHLPSYMIPAFFVQLDQMPLTVNGKIDKKALPKPDAAAMASGAEYTAPRNEIEAMLADCWQTVLGVARISIYDNFFEVGGDSIKAIQISARLNKQGCKMVISDLFKNPTIAELSKYIKTVTQTHDQGTVEGDVLLTPIQRWFFEEHQTDLHHFNQANMLYRQEGFDPDVLRQVFARLVEHHDALRMSFTMDADSLRQVNKGISDTNEHALQLEVIDLTQVADETILAERIEQEASRIQASIDLNGPLVKLGLFQTGAGDHLLIAIHHLVIDGVSWRILLEDFTSAYTQASQGEAITFPEKTTSFQEWAKQLDAYATSKALLQEKGYWNQVGQAQVRPLPTDHVISDNRMQEATTLTIELSREHTGQLLKDAHRAYRTEVNDILLTALGKTVTDWTGDDQVLLLLEGHGREDIIEDADITRTISWFTSSYPVVLDLSKATDTAYRVKYVKETLRQIPNKGIGYGILKYLTPAESKQDITFGLQPQISFNYLGQFDQEAKTGVFSVSPMSSGVMVSPNMERDQLIDITGVTVGGQLKLSVMYNHHAFDPGNMERFTDQLKANLLAVVEHCVSQTTSERTPSDLGYGKLSIDEWESIRRFVQERAGEAEIAKLYPLSPMQEGMLFHASMDHESFAYLEQYRVPLRGTLELGLLEQSLNTVIDRYDVLRTVFAHEGLHRPLQIVLGERTTSITFEDISHLDHHGQSAYLEACKQQDKERGFDLTQDMLIRAAILQTGYSEYQMIFTFHHILADGWCIPIIIGEFFHIYHQLLNGLPLELAPVYPYSDYIDWLEQQDKAEATTYWTEYLAGYEQLATLPKLRHGQEGEYDHRTHVFYLDEETTSGLELLAKQHHATMNTLFQAVWGILLARYNRVDDVVFGAVVSGRNANIPGIEQMVGLFINSVPIRIQMGSDQDFAQLMQQVQGAAFASASYDYLSLADIQATSDLRQGLLDHLIAFENYPTPSEDGRAVLDKRLEMDFEQAEVFEQTNYDFNIAVGPGDKLFIKFMYNGLVYDQQLVENIAAHLTQVVRTILTNPSVKLREIDVVTSEERTLLVDGFNQTKVAYPADQTIHQLFEQQAKTQPDHLALHFEGEQLTYRQLNEKANQLARVLVAQGVVTDQIVAIMTDRSLEMIVAILAVLKAGGAYVPIDPAHPAERIAFMLEDSQAKVVLTQDHLRPIVSSDTVAYAGVVLDLTDPSLYVGDDSNLLLPVRTTDMAYVIYTSGTTGKPKGVMVEHHGIPNLISYFRNHYGVNEQDRVLQNASFSFDVSVKEIFMGLLNGAALYIPTKETTQDPALFEAYMSRHQISVTALSPVFLVHVDPDKLTSLRLLFTGGSAITADLVDTWKDRVIYINAYGPTEASVQATGWNTREARTDGVLPIGRPIDNTQVYVVGTEHQLQPIGVAGELCIGGVGLARGYLNRPELTAEKFVDNPFVPGEKMYKTGDLVRWLPDGQIEYLGRLDDQVKVRGFRIELGEIEAKLLTHEVVKEAIVLAHTDERGQTDLCAYIVTETDVTITELRQHLGQDLPAYMIPAYFVTLEKMPTTINGKIDKRALPKPDGMMDTGVAYVAPRNETEAKLVAIWQDLLGVERISVHDDFFALGGHSLKATLLLSRLHKEFDTQTALRSIFQHPTVAELAQIIQQGQKSAFTAIQPVERREFYPVSSAQKRLLILTQLEGAELTYNMPFAVKLSGEVDPVRLEASIQTLVDRHESLRTSFDWTDGQMRQYVWDQATFRLVHRQVTADQVEGFMAEFTQPFNLNEAPLFRAELLTYSGNEHVLMMDMHHIISDGVSMNILLGELSAVYLGKDLPELSIQYKDFAVWQQEQAQSTVLQKQEAYWLEALAGDIPALQMPTDYPRPAVYSYDGDSLSFMVDQDLAQSLNQLAQATGTTMYMVLIAALQVTLSKYSGQEEILVGSPVAGRPHADLQSIVGMFINTLVMRGYPAAEKSFADFLAEMRETALHAFENQDYPFEELVEKLALKRDMSRNQLFDVLFTLQNMGERDEQWALGEAKAAPYELPYQIATFDITVTARELGEGIGFELNYATKLFKRETMQRFAAHYKQVLRQIVNNHQVRLAEIDMVTEAEKHQLLVEFNDTRGEFPAEASLIQLFEAQVALRPDKHAIYFEGQALTYREMNERANQLARVLIAKGVGTEDTVAIMTDRSLEMYVAILAVLKAGGVYVPVDPVYPAERIQFILEDSQAKVLLTQTHLLGQVQDHGQVLDLNEAHLFVGETSNLDVQTTADQLAYIIYTSGTTGKPKGVMLENRGVVNLIVHLQTTYGFTDHDRITQYASQSFDPSIMEIFVTLLSGATLYVPTNEVRQDPVMYQDFVVEHQITAMDIPVVFAAALKPEKMPSLRFVSTGGSALTPAVAKIWKDHVHFVNSYGPTETTVQSTEWTVVEREDRLLPIGRPIPNTQIYIVSRHNQLQPLGVPGELCIGGVGLARGYLNRPDLTEEKFVTNPFAADEKIYKTGDLARWLPDGNIEFLGRLDDQVKVRGYRIELSEVESHILSHDEITETVVIVHPDPTGQDQLCAYIEAKRPMSVAELRDHLAQTLPSYMIPSYFVQVESMPLTVNNKIDKKALPAPEGNMDTGTEYEAPANEMEEKLAAIWAQLLGMGRVSVEADFFELGGHSLRAVELVSAVSKEMNLDMPLQFVFRYRTIRNLAQKLDELQWVQVDQEAPVTLLNEAGNPIIFAFPPIAGLGAAFKELADELTGTSIYAFDYIHHENLVDEYIKHILTIQPTGSYMLMGYSAGGNVAFEMAKAMEAKGHKVESIILLDSVRQVEMNSMSEEQIRESVELIDKAAETNEILRVPSIRKRVAASIQSYSTYLNSFANEGVIQADIHLILATDAAEREDHLKWKQSTQSHYSEYAGHATHQDMVSAEAAKPHAELIRQILFRTIPVEL
ncbi:non-ribosomal peptide synthase/polyketide synthase [Brevibacillus dissolubilis]|uniref:non-ribosomal peptide synthase/polyketide synthase n=1 Tax=Brevibacillus dissolubilis TaxID=1844116 RepID=UPI00159BE2C8|nr:non-ribosomal peptide synthase/polyketide synthase [Brevibacillus dissolubilis]